MRGALCALIKIREFVMADTAQVGSSA